MIFKLHQGIGVGDRERVADKGHSERRVEPFEKYMPGFGGTIGLHTTQ